MAKTRRRPALKGQGISADRNEPAVFAFLSHRSLQRVEVLGVGAGNFLLGGGGQVFAVKKFLHQLMQVGARRFVGEVGGPEQTIIPKQLDIPLRGISSPH